MQFRYEKICELPFILNIQSGVYDVAFADKIVTLKIDNNLYAASKQGSTTSSIAMIGSEEQVRRFVAGNTSYALIKLRTVIIRNESRKVPFIPIASNKMQLEYFHSGLKYNNYSSEVSEDELKQSILRLSAKERFELVLKASAETISHAIYKPEQGYDFIVEINRVIQKYCTEYNDHFAQEVSLHDICQTTCGGIIQAIYVNGLLLSNATLAGKFPPIFKQSWFNHEDVTGKSFKDILRCSAPIDQVKMLLVRARSLCEKGAYRSSIIESAAALEAEVTNLIRVSLSERGWQNDEIDLHLRNNQKFDDRAKRILKEVQGFTLAELDGNLWRKTKECRDKLRHKIAHSDVEPTLTDAESAINAFYDMIMKLREKVNSKP